MSTSREVNKAPYTVSMVTLKAVTHRPTTRENDSRHQQKSIR